MFGPRLVRAVAIALAGAAMPAAAQVPVQRIELHSFGYSPQLVRLSAGKPITLTFVNRSRDGHDFTARSFFQRARFIAGAAPGGEIELKGGQSRSVTLVPAAGRYKVHCGHFLHKQMGMSGAILVE